MNFKNIRTAEKFYNKKKFQNIKWRSDNSVIVALNQIFFLIRKH